MKAKYIFASLIAALAVLAGCQKEEAVHYLSTVKVSSSYVAVPLDGGSNEITVDATTSWTIADMPSWLTVNPTSGSAGQTKVTFSAPKALDGRTAEIHLSCGNKVQNINVIQGLSTVSTATCAEVIAGPDSKTYRVSGVVTSIVNTQYGNWYLDDGTGVVYIYGTLDSKGNTKNFLSWGLEVGDEITVEGPKTTYNGTVELVDVTVIKINKSLIKVAEMDPEDALLPVEGGNFTVTLDNKGNGVYVEIPEDAQDWLSISSIAGNVVTFKAAANEGGDRETTITFKTTDGKKDYTAQQALSQKGAIVEVTVAEFKEAEVGTALYRITGKIRGIVNSTYGNIYIEDATGYVYVYTLFENSDKVAKSFANLGVNEGDIITVVGPRDEYPGAKVEDQKIQMKNAYCEKAVKAKAATITEVIAAPVASTYLEGQYYRVTGVVKEIVSDVYGNIYFKEKDSDTYIYVYGITAAPVAKNDKSFGALGIAAGDEITIVGQRGAYPNSKVEDQKIQMSNSYFLSKSAE